MKQTFEILTENGLHAMNLINALRIYLLDNNVDAKEIERDGERVETSKIFYELDGLRS